MNLIRKVKCRVADQVANKNLIVIVTVYTVCTLVFMALQILSPRLAVMAIVSITINVASRYFVKRPPKNLTKETS